MSAPASNLIPFLVLIPLVGWRMYSRVRRSVGRQTLSKVRPWITIAIFPLAAVLLGWQALGHARPELLWSLAGGIAGGGVLGFYGLRHTKFEVMPDGMFYTPNAHIGIALSTLFTGRVLYRMYALYNANPYADPASSNFAASPLTLGIFGLLAGYYVTYAIGLVRWRLSVEGAKHD